MPSKHRHRALLFAGLLFLPLSAPRAEDCPTLQALSLNGHLLVMLGSREPDASMPELRLAGCGSATPRLHLRWTRGTDGEWSQAGELPESLSGVAFQHGKRPWTAGLTEPAPGRLPSITLAPLGPAGKTAHSEAPREAAALAVAVAALDRWTFALVQHLPAGRLLVEELTSHGRNQVLERVSGLVVQTDWPEGSRLLGVAGEPGTMAIFARTPDGSLLTVIAEAEGWLDCVPLSLPPPAQAEGLWLEGAPAAFVAAAGEISAWSLSGVAWRQRGNAAAPTDRLWAAGVFGEDAGRIGAVAWDGAALEAWTWQEDAWTEEVVPPGQIGSLVRPAAPEPAAPAAAHERPRALLRTLLIGLGLAGALVGAALSARLLKRR